MPLTAPGVANPCGYFVVSPRITLGSAAKSISRVELNSKKPPSDGIIDVVHAALQGVLADGLGDVVPELPLSLERLLRNVGIGAEGCVRKSHQRRADVAGDHIIPILVARRELVDGVVEITEFRVTFARSAGWW